MNRLLRVFLLSVLAFLSFAAPVLAETIPIVLDAADLESKGKISLHLPAGSFDCTGTADGTATTTELSVEALYDPAGVTIRTTQVSGDCEAAREDRVVLSHLELGLVSAKISLGAEKTWVLFLEFEKSLPTDGRLAHLLRAAVGGRGGVVVRDPVCDQHTCKFIGEDADQLLTKLPKLAGARVSALHGDAFSSAVTKDGQVVSPKLVNVEWIISKNLTTDTRVIPDISKPIFSIEDRAYRILMKTGAIDCKIAGQERIIKSCASISRATPKAYQVEITDAAALKALRGHQSLTLLVAPDAELEHQDDGTKVQNFAIDVAQNVCRYEIVQVPETKVLRGMRSIEVLLQMKSVDGSEACKATDGWVVKSTAPDELKILDQNEIFRLKAETSMGKASRVTLQFFYESGIPVETKGPVIVTLDERKSFSNYSVSVYSGSKCAEKGDKLPGVSKKNQMIARGHANVLTFDDVNAEGLRNWQFDQTTVSGGTQRETGSGEKQQDTAVCIDTISESAGQTRIRFRYNFNGAIGEAEEEITLSQQDLAIKQSLPGRMRLVCEDGIADSNRSTTVANKVGSLRRCNLLVELEDGKFNDLTGKNYPRYSAQDKLTKKVKESQALEPNACDATSSSGDGGEGNSYTNFIRTWGEQELLLKLWSAGADGEFIEANGEQGQIIRLGATPSLIDAGPYRHVIANGVLAICIDLTYGGAIASSAYDVVKLSVEYSDDHYATDWNGGGFDAPFVAKRRRMPVMGWKYRGSAIGHRLFFSLAVPTLIRVPALGVDEQLSSEYRRASMVAFEAGVLVGLEWWNFDENNSILPVFAPQLYAGVMFLGIPTQDNPRVLRPSGVAGLGLRIPTGSPTTKSVQGLTSLVVWAEFAESARQTLAVSALLGFKVELAIFGG